MSLFLFTHLLSKILFWMSGTLFGAGSAVIILDPKDIKVASRLTDFYQSSIKDQRALDFDAINNPGNGIPSVFSQKHDLKKGPIIISQSRGEMHYFEALSCATKYFPQMTMKKLDISCLSPSPNGCLPRNLLDKKKIILSKDEAVSVLIDALKGLGKSKTTEGKLFFQKKKRKDRKQNELLKFFLQREALRVVNFAAKYRTEFRNDGFVKKFLEDKECFEILKQNLIAACVANFEEVVMVATFENFVLDSHDAHLCSDILKEFPDMLWPKIFPVLSSALFERIERGFLEKKLPIDELLGNLFQKAKNPEIFEAMMAKSPPKNQKDIVKELTQVFGSRIVTHDDGIFSLQSSLWFHSYSVLYYMINEEHSSFLDNFQGKLGLVVLQKLEFLYESQIIAYKIDQLDVPEDKSLGISEPQNLEMMKSRDLAHFYFERWSKIKSLKMDLEALQNKISSFQRKRSVGKDLAMVELGNWLHKFEVKTFLAIPFEIWENKMDEIDSHAAVLIKYLENHETST